MDHTITEMGLVLEDRRNASLGLDRRGVYFYISLPATDVPSSTMQPRRRVPERKEQMHLVVMTEPDQRIRVSPVRRSHTTSFEHLFFANLERQVEKLGQALSWLNDVR